MISSPSLPEQPASNEQYKDISLLYRFLAQSLKFPEHSWFTDDYKTMFFSMLDQLEANTESEDLRVFFAQTDDFIEDLQIEYTRLFINGVPHVVAPPYGSVYLDKSLQGLHASKTLTYYREKGCAMAEGSDLPDHIVHELEFLSHLAEDGDLAGEKEFLQNYFLAWFPAFRNRVLSEAHHPYYRLVITMIDYFTKEEE
jgi:TorA maturation chaperone TorD